jgi:hypothetical protein
MDLVDGANEFAFFAAFCTTLVTSPLTSFWGLLVWVVVFELLFVGYCRWRGSKWCLETRVLVFLGSLCGFLLGKQLYGWKCAEGSLLCGPVGRFPPCS